MGVNIARLSRQPEAATMTPVIHVKDIVEGMLLPLHELERVSIPDSPQYERQFLRTGDILVSARGTLMKCAIVPPSHRGSVASANFIVIRCGDRTLLRAELLCAFLRQPAVQASVLGRITSTAQPALTIRELENIEVSLPLQDIQTDLTNLLAAAEEQYRVAVTCARLRREEAMDILARYMDPMHAS